ncbi:GNAT family N-acetyltransferase [Granulicella sp. WH15]|nr:GNAT family N-acetyltransferase [Granulicella sp. WH15]QHN04481.1 GNAT family N-acetyltransferase [Granulicella sp. WH15]
MHVIRPATSEDAPEILAFIRELALYEREPDAVRASLSDILRDGWGPQKRFHCLLAESDGAPAGFALYFHNYSTWRGHAGIHVEDLYVRPAYRRRGIGKALLAAVAAIAIDEGCPRLQWDVLEWNTPAITFYEAIGAKRLMEWRTMRISDSALSLLASASSSGSSVDSPGAL